MSGHILITGGAGYIGSHVCYALRNAGYTPVVIDNLSSGHRSMVKFGPLIEGNIEDKDLIRNTCQTYMPKALMHFAAYIDVAESMAQPQKYFDNNIENAKVLFSTAQSCGIQNIILSSTAAVYGTPVTSDPITEDHPLGPINPYGESKRRCEEFLRSMNGVSSITLRYFNAAGAADIETGIGEAHTPETHLIPRALLSVNSNTVPFRIFGNDYPTPDGTAIRDYVHVMDIAQAHLLALHSLVNHGGQHVYNIGSGTGYSVHQIVEAISQQTGESLRTEYSPRRIGDPPVLLANIDNIRQTLGWTPQYGLQEIISSALRWHQSDTYKILVSGH